MRFRDACDLGKLKVVYLNVEVEAGQDEIMGINHLNTSTPAVVVCVPIEPLLASKKIRR